MGYCTCGERIYLTHGKKEGYITCRGSKAFENKGCDHKSLRYRDVENAFTNFLKFDASKLVRDENGNGSNVQVQILQGRLIETEKQIQNITEALTVAVTKSLVIRQAELEKQVEEIKKQIELESAKVASLKGKHSTETGNETPPKFTILGFLLVLRLESLLCPNPPAQT